MFMSYETGYKAIANKVKVVLSRMDIDAFMAH
jgi:hypothetical protein